VDVDVAEDEPVVEEAVEDGDGRIATTDKFLVAAAAAAAAVVVVVVVVACSYSALILSTRSSAIGS